MLFVFFFLGIVTQQHQELKHLLKLPTDKMSQQKSSKIKHTVPKSFTKCFPSISAMNLNYEIVFGVFVILSFSIYI